MARRLLLVLMFWAAQGDAQETSIAGIVTAGDTTPLAHAQVRLLGTEFSTESGADGAFRLRGIPLGRQILEVRLIGYAPVFIPARIDARQTHLIRVSLKAEAVPLEAVSVTADPAVPFELRGFYSRKARGTGTFFTGDDIKRMQPRLFTDVLRRVPGMQVTTDLGVYGTNNAARSARATGMSGPRACPVLFYLDGAPFPVTGDIPINNYIATAEIAAVEVYNGVSQIPPQFLSSALNARCGVIVIWTLSGRTARRPR